MSRFITLLSALLLVVSVSVSAQTSSAPAETNIKQPLSLHRVTAYPSWQAALITLANGKVVRAPKANIFLKRSSLIYLNSREKTMEVPTYNIKTVDFADRHYVRIDSMLYWRVDTVGKNALYCCARIDAEGLKQQMINSRDFTNVQLGSEFLNTTTLDAHESDFDYPIDYVYYYYFKDKWVRVYDRGVWKIIPKKKRDIYKEVTTQADFTWSNAASLMTLLRKITNAE